MEKITKNSMPTGKGARKQHHIWCNFWGTNPATCKLCDALEEKYPTDESTPDELLEKHFPDVVKK